MRCVLTSAHRVAEIEYISGVREHRVDIEVDGGRSTVDTTTLIIRRPTPTVVKHSWKSSVISTVGGHHRTAAELSGSASNRELKIRHQERRSVPTQQFAPRDSDRGRHKLASSNRRSAATQPNSSPFSIELVVHIEKREHRIVN